MGTERPDIRIWISGFEEARADQDGGHEERVTNKARVMRLECQLPKGKTELAAVP